MKIRRTPAKKRPKAATAKQLQDKLIPWLEENQLAGDATFYTGAAWKERGEPYGGKSIATIQTEGRLGSLVNHHYDAPAWYKLEEEFDALLESLGVYYEMSNHYSLHFYPRG